MLYPERLFDIRALRRTKTRIVLLPAFPPLLWSRLHFTERMPSTPSLLLHICFYVIDSLSSWGRILAATGSVPLSPSSATGVAPVINPTKVNVTFVPSDGTSPLPVLVNGEPEKVDEVRAKEILQLEDFEVLVELGMGGDGEAKYWTCDFSYVSRDSCFHVYMTKRVFPSGIR